MANESKFDHQRTLTYIRTAKGAGEKDATIARKLYCFDHPLVLEGDMNAAFYIFNRVALQFRIPFSHVRAVGSAQVGYSLIKNKPFDPMS